MLTDRLRHHPQGHDNVNVVEQDLIFGLISSRHEIRTWY